MYNQNLSFTFNNTISIILQEILKDKTQFCLELFLKKYFNQASSLKNVFD